MNSTVISGTPRQEIDEDDAEQPHDRQARAPPERQQDPERQRGDDADERHDQGHSMPPQSAVGTEGSPRLGSR